MPIVGPLDINVLTGLYNNNVAETDMSTTVSTTEGRTAIVIDFKQGAGLISRDLETTFTWPLTAGTILYIWQPSVFPLPETTTNRASDWTDGGSPTEKFIQGYSIEADSFNVPKTLQLQSADDLSIHTFNETPVAFNGQSRKVFSCSPPFIAHSVRRLSDDGVPWQVFSENLIFEPFPEAAMAWQTELSTLGMVGWAHLREMNLAHISTADLTLILTFDSWPTIVLSIPNSGGSQQKVKVMPPINKWKLIAFGATSAQPFRIFVEDIECKVGFWGRTVQYEVLHPFGGQSSAGAVV
jgi:hypothetical protein